MLGYYAKNRREFIVQLFMQPAFDGFAVSEAAIVTDYSSHFSGERLDRDAAEPYVLWEELRPVALSLIKGKSLRSFQLTLLLTREKTAAFLRSAAANAEPESVRGLFLNLRYREETLSVTSGVARDGFSMDKTLEQAWDRQLRLFLERLGLGEEV